MHYKGLPFNQPKRPSLCLLEDLLLFLTSLLHREVQRREAGDLRLVPLPNLHHNEQHAVLQRCVLLHEYMQCRYLQPIELCKRQRPLQGHNRADLRQQLHLLPFSGRLLYRQRPR